MTRADFSLVIAINCRSLYESMPLPPAPLNVGLIRLLPLVGVPAIKRIAIKVSACQLDFIAVACDYFHVEFRHPSMAHKSMGWEPRCSPKMTLTVLIPSSEIAVRLVERNAMRLFSMTFNRRMMYSPNIATKTGWAFRPSASGSVIETVRTDPRLVPTHNVGNIDVGSEKEFIASDTFHHSTFPNTNHFSSCSCQQRPSMSQIRCWCFLSLTLTMIVIAKTTCPTCLHGQWFQWNDEIERD